MNIDAFYTALIILVAAAVTFGTRAMTLVTRHIFFEFKFLFYSGRDLLQRQLHFHTKVTAAIPALL